MNDILRYLIEVSSITGLLIFLGKFIVNWFGKAGLEKYKSDLNIEVHRFRNMLDKEFEQFKIKHTRLHIEQVDIIKNLYSKLIIAEKPLEYLMRPVKISPNKTKDELANEVITNANDFFDYFEINEIIFDENICNRIKLIKDKYLEVWGTFSKKEFLNAKGGDLYIQMVDEMHVAYDKILQGEMQILKKQLKDDFRQILGVI